MAYYAIDPKTGELKHWKYIYKKKVNGKWRYYYKDDLKKDDEDSIDPDDYDFITKDGKSYYRKKGTKGKFVTSNGDTYERKKSNELFDRSVKTTRAANLSSRTTHTVEYKGKISQTLDKAKKEIDKGRRWFESLFD